MDDADKFNAPQLGDPFFDQSLSNILGIYYEQADRVGAHGRTSLFADEWVSGCSARQVALRTV